MIYCTAAAAALASATPVLAQDAAPATAAPNGFRVEALVGYDRPGTDGFHFDGVLFGVGAGYDLPVSNTVALGLDVEASDSTAKKYGVSTGRDLYAGGRISVALSPRTNLYVKGGYTNARVKLSGFGGANGDGFRLGAGGQYLISGKAYVGAEYRYSNYESDVDRHQVALTLGTRF
jgi:outer membrane immunogenic protein